MRKLLTLLVVAGGIACAQIAPGSAAYKAASAIANDPALNAVNVACTDYTTTAGALCFETEAPDSAVARQVIDHAMQDHKAVGLWSRGAYGTDSKIWRLEDGRHLRVAILSMYSVVLVITSNAPATAMPSPPEPAPQPQDAALQRLAEQGAAEFGQVVHTQSTPCPTTMTNSVCLAAWGPVEALTDRTFPEAVGNWSGNPKGVHTRRYRYHDQYLSVSVAPAEPGATQLKVTISAQKSLMA